MNSYSGIQTFALTTLRAVTGWHFLYEGLAKLLSPGWTSLPYLLDSKGWFAPLFKSMAANQTMVCCSDFITQWGLILVGLGLISGLFTRVSIIGAAGFLLLFYASHPSYVGVKYLSPSEGNFLWVDRNIIEMCVLFVLYLFPVKIGLDGLFRNKKRKSNKKTST